MMPTKKVSFTRQAMFKAANQYADFMDLRPQLCDFPSQILYFTDRYTGDTIRISYRDVLARLKKLEETQE